MILRTLGIDLGTNSLGWCLIETSEEPCSSDEGRIVAIGSRIFSQAEMAGRDAKSKESLAVARRDARSARRRRDRYLARRATLLRILTDYGLMPADDHARKALVRETGDGRGGDLTSSIYALRMRALEERLTPHQIGRVLFHLNQRRGFKSNRKTDRGDNEAGKISTGVARLQTAMAEADAPTLGAFLHQQRMKGQSVRARLGSDAGPDGKGEGYAFYPSREELEREFDRICSAQTEHHPDLLTPERIAHIRRVIFFQRPLKAPKVGKCSYNPHETRLPKAHPLFQAFRLYKEVNELEIVGEDQRHAKLTPEQRDTLVAKLRSARTVTFTSLRKVLKLGPEFRFNKETEARPKMAGDEVYVAMSHKDAFGGRWARFDMARQWEIIQKLIEAEDADALVAWLVENVGFAPENAENVAKVQLPAGYGRLGETALTGLLDALKTETNDGGTVITEAVAAYRVHGRTNAEDDPNREGIELLPNYQEILERHVPPGTGEPDDPYDLQKGRLTNPTVHIALNQLRRVVNAIIKRHGKPDRISIELGRDLKLNEEKRAEVNRTIARNTRDAEARSAKLRELGQPDTGYYRMRLKLWEELNLKDPSNRVCIYTGEPISPTQLFSAEVDVDHILPYSKTLDDSQANRIVCKAHANRAKKNQAPAEVAAWREHYADILARAGTLPRNKQWRFAEDAMEKFRDEEGFVARQLTDMQYMARLARTYLNALYDAEAPDKHGELRRTAHVRALPGRTTEMLRRRWALNELLPDHNHIDSSKAKNRNDHRHHAIDAFVIACTSRAMIQKIASASATLEAQGAENVVAKAPDPWPGFRNELRVAVNAIVVSHKPDHGTVSRDGYASGKGQTAAKLHNDTAYGLTGETDERGKPIVVVRKPLIGFASANDLQAIRDPQLRDALWTATDGLSGKDFTAALTDFAMRANLDGRPHPYRGLRRVRVTETLATIPVYDPDGKPYKGYKGDSNHRYDVWCLPDGKWKSEVVSTFDAHQPDWRSAVKEQYPTARKVLRLHQNDMVAAGEGEERAVYRVVKFNSAGRIFFAPHQEGGALKARDAAPNDIDPFKYVTQSASGLKKSGFRQVRLDEIGSVFDPGPRA